MILDYYIHYHTPCRCKDIYYFRDNTELSRCIHKAKKSVIIGNWLRETLCVQNIHNNPSASIVPDKINLLFYICSVSPLSWQVDSHLILTELAYQWKAGKNIKMKYKLWRTSARWFLIFYQMCPMQGIL